ncbi:FtsW/RodA/SpoVE family cell cycle protein [Evansella tamaricis]|uniref:Rod shape-determining protein RodA n=1 Tax=Evansella tamaricis TaxID=2069301 RepID=A0ABS6JJ84_9BACI|nr:FtsW/RodA/SpoVE family cell cycle protein [Evansella tamaricis]MBU9713746.1 rod shape-determining protein RodA [Evansella tamaricis]
MQERKTSFQQLDFTLLFLLFVLMCISLLAVYSGSAPLTARWGWDPFHFVQRQILWFGVGTILMIAAMSIDYELFKNFSIPLYALGMILLLLVEFTPLGIEVNGAKRWLGIEGVFRFQPSEFVKIFVLITLAHVLYNITKNPMVKSFRSDVIVVGKILGVGLPPFALILIQPDLGTALVIGAVMFSMIVMSGVTYRMIALLTTLALSGIGLLVWLHNNYFELFSLIIKSHQLDRIYAWLDPQADIAGQGFQLYQAIQGIGAGKLYGSGLASGVKSQSGTIPELHTDFIFTVIGEEFGFVGATVLIVVYFLLLYRMVIIAFSCNNTFGTYLVAGSVGLFVFQIFQNVGMTIGLMPITGLALPFISYGGSALMTSMLAIGIVLNVNIRTKHYMFGEED